MDSTDSLFAALETERLRLRCVRASDAGAFAAMMTPGVGRRVASWPAPCTVAMAATRVAAARDGVAAGRGVTFGVERLSDGVLMGWIGVSRVGTAERRAMLGYWLGEAFQGQGYMREAAGVAVAAAFRMLGADVVAAAAQPDNAGSIAVLRGCGMRLVGEQMMFAEARQREELCVLYEVQRSWD